MKKNIDQEVKKTVKAMIIGSIIYNLVLLIGVVIFSIIYYKADLLILIKNVLSVLIGSVLCVIGIYSLLATVITSLDYGEEKKAKAHMIFNSILRIVVFIMILLVIMKLFGVVSGLIYVLSIFGIKIGAYMEPKLKERI